MKPFVKWVGGKRKVIEKYLSKMLPKTYDKYIEPFVGGGAMFFYLKPKKAIINDLNSELITSYKEIKNNVYELIEKLELLNEIKDRENFLKIRETIEMDSLNIAARFIYLNKTSFNGMYRVNSEGKFNVPYNPNSINSNLFNKDNILSINEFLKNNDISIFNKDYKKIFKQAKKGDFVFCDPPYDYEEGTKTFDSYTKEGFGQRRQKELANMLYELDEKGVKWMLTNHNTKLIKELYKEFKIVEIVTDRMVNSNAKKRKSTGKEVVVMNYEY